MTCETISPCPPQRVQTVEGRVSPLGRCRVRKIPSWPICQADFRGLGFSWLPAASVPILLTAAGPGLLPRRLVGILTCGSSSSSSSLPPHGGLSPRPTESGYARSSNSTRPGTVPPARPTHLDRDLLKRRYQERWTETRGMSPSAA